MRSDANHYENSVRETVMDVDSLLDFDRQHIWHPYSAVGADLPLFPVSSAEGVRLRLEDGRELIDGMSSWWSVIHGYNHPVMNQALADQIKDMSHVMFGGLTHRPAVELARRLVELAPERLDTVFFCDSGSVAVEVSMKMAIQYWHDRGAPTKQLFATVRGGYHGDTFDAMSVCDPVNGMHGLFQDALTQQFFVDRPTRVFDEPCTDEDMAAMDQCLAENHERIAAVILEPVVQGAGGMRFYSPDYLRRLRLLCDKYGVLLICDEIATGFGRTGRMFACEYAGISPDILCVGKALTGGYMSMAATLATREVAEVISNGDPGLFMHGPTFMANPLACSAALASLKLLVESPWQERVRSIESGLKTGLAAAKDFDHVADVRVLGAIGVVELTAPVDMKTVQPGFVDAGIWVRPFGRLVYLMPPFVIDAADLDFLTSSLVQVVGRLRLGSKEPGATLMLG